MSSWVLGDDFDRDGSSVGAGVFDAGVCVVAGVLRCSLAHLCISTIIGVCEALFLLS